MTPTQRPGGETPDRDAVTAALRALCRGLAPGDELGTIRDLAAKLGTTVVEVDHARQVLEREGWIVRPRPRGPLIRTEQQFEDPPDTPAEPVGAEPPGTAEATADAAPDAPKPKAVVRVVRKPSNPKPAPEPPAPRPRAMPVATEPGSMKMAGGAPSRWKELADKFERAIDGLEPGAPIGTAADLMRTHGASRESTKAALVFLQNKGKVVRTPGRRSGWSKPAAPDDEGREGAVGPTRVPDGATSTGPSGGAAEPPRGPEAPPPAG